MVLTVLLRSDTDYIVRWLFQTFRSGNENLETSCEIEIHLLDKDKLKVKVEAELNVSQKIGEGRSKKSWTNEKTMMIIVFCMVFCKGNNS